MQFSGPLYEESNSKTQMKQRFSPIPCPSTTVKRPYLSGFVLQCFWAMTSQTSATVMSGTTASRYAEEYWPVEASSKNIFSSVWRLFMQGRFCREGGRNLVPPKREISLTKDASQQGVLVVLYRGSTVHAVK